MTSPVSIPHTPTVSQISKSRGARSSPTSRRWGIENVMRIRRIACMAVALTAAAQTPAGQWQSMFDGKTLKGWKETPFTGRGKVTIEDGTILLGAGHLTGITWTGDFPKSNYEVRLEAARLQG